MLNLQQLLQHIILVHQEGFTCGHSWSSLFQSLGNSLYQIGKKENIHPIFVCNNKKEEKKKRKSCSSYTSIIK